MIYGYQTSEGSRKRTACKCKCDCGNTTIKKVDDIRAGKGLSCGCDREEMLQARGKLCRKDLTGKKFGRLTVVEMDWTLRQSKARCICDCGNEIWVIGSGLTTGKTQSCGCLQSERAIEANTKDWTGVTSPYGVRFIKQHRTNDKGQWIWECECPLCGESFCVLPAKAMSGHTTSCGCRRSSAAEKLIKETLERNNVEYATEYTIPECKHRKSLRFDFALFQNSELYYLIEYDGKQHYEPIDYFGGEDALELTRKRDNIKNEYCQNNNIPLLRLPYTLTPDEIKQKIEDILNPERL